VKPFDASGAFRPLTDASGLRRAAVRGAGVMVLAQVAAFMVQVIATVVLARLLTPADFGVVTMVTTFSLLLASCGQIGFPELVMQREEINHALVSNLFWINLSASLVLSAGFAAAASPLARFYHDPRVMLVTVVVSLTIFLTSTSVLHLGLLKRAMRFSAVSANDIVARAVSVAVSILLAWAGWGYWALVAGAIALPVSTCVGAWMLCRWIPGLPRRAAGTGSAVRFAFHVYGRFGVDYITRNLGNLLVGWRFGSTSLGFYKKAYDLFSLSSNQLLSVFPVVVSTLSRMTRNPVQYRRYFLGGLSVLALVGMGVSGTLTLVGGDLVRLVMGPRWDTAGQMLRLFGPGTGVMLIYGTHGMIHLSIGTPARWLRWGLIEFSVTGLLIVLGLHWGPAGVAAAWTVSFWILIVPAFWYAGRPIQFGVAPVLAAVWKYLVASLIAACSCAVIIQKISYLQSVPGSLGAAARIIVTSMIFGGMYIGLAMLLHRSFEPLDQLSRLLPDLMPSRWSSPKPVSVEGAGMGVPAGQTSVPNGA
jgi:O-antigen/teichoic acid export membrane protein